MRTKNLVLILLIISLLLSGALIWLIHKRQREARREAGMVKLQSARKIEQLNEDLTTKERELTSKTIFINQKNQMLEKLIAELEVLKKSEVSPGTIHHLQVQLRQELSPNAWKEFELQFNEVHPASKEDYSKNSLI